MGAAIPPKSPPGVPLGGPGVVPVETPAAKQAGIVAESSKAQTNLIEGPDTVGATSMANIPEAFPLNDLGQLEARGLAGQTFLLDGGALKGMKLQIRRVIDGDRLYDHVQRTQWRVTQIGLQTKDQYQRRPLRRR